MGVFKNLLIVNDDEVTNFVLIHKLIGLNMADHIFTAGNGAEAMDLILDAAKGIGEHEMPDLLLLDLSMPHMDGIEFLFEFSNFLDSNDLPELPMVLFSASQKPDIEVLRHIYSFIKGELSLPFKQDELKRLAELKQLS